MISKSLPDDHEDSESRTLQGVQESNYNYGNF